MKTYIVTISIQPGIVITLAVEGMCTGAYLYGMFVWTIIGADDKPVITESAMVRISNEDGSPLPRI